MYLNVLLLLCTYYNDGFNYNKLNNLTKTSDAPGNREFQKKD